MSTGQTVLVGLLVVITVLFVGAVANQRRADTGGVDSGSSGPVALLHRRVGDAAQVDRANASATCPISAAGAVTVPGQCVVRVAAHGSQIPQLRLRAQSPVTVTAPVPRRDITVAVVAIGLVVLVELGSPLLGGHDASDALVNAAGSLGGLPPDAGAMQPPGRGIPYLALIDVIVLFTMALMGAGLLLPDRLHGRVQGVITLVASIVLIVVAVTLLVIASVLLLAMVSLFFAPPFGTIAYLVILRLVPARRRGGAAAAAVPADVPEDRVRRDAGPRPATFPAYVVLAFLHGLVPIILVSIVDDVGAIVSAVVAIVWDRAAGRVDTCDRQGGDGVTLTADGVMVS